MDCGREWRTECLDVSSKRKLSAERARAGKPSKSSKSSKSRGEPYRPPYKWRTESGERSLWHFCLFCVYAWCLCSYAMQMRCASDTLENSSTEDVGEKGTMGMGTGYAKLGLQTKGPPASRRFQTVRQISRSINEYVRAPCSALNPPSQQRLLEARPASGPQIKL